MSTLKPKYLFCDTLLVHNPILEYGLLFHGKFEGVKLLQIRIIFGVFQLMQETFKILCGVLEYFKYFQEEI
jgi:hypothetical protein